MPSYVEAIFISTRSLSMPRSLYKDISFVAFSIVASVLYDSLKAMDRDYRASTSVDTLPGTILRISAPKFTI